jgi:hypothetical protein
MQVNGLVWFLMNQKVKTMAPYRRKVTVKFYFLFYMKFPPDGTTVRYFSCNDNYGLYVRPAQIESVINDLQPDLARSASNHSIISQGSSTGSVPPPSTSTAPKAGALPTKQSGLRAPTPSSATKPPGIN